MPEPEWLNRTINIDTGCVFGGKLTALRWPEKELVSVPARQTYADPVRPFMPVSARSLNAQQASDDLLDIEDVRGKRLVTTRLHRNVTVREENAAAALEVMSRFAANPKWLIRFVHEGDGLLMRTPYQVVDLGIQPAKLLSLPGGRT